MNSTMQRETQIDTSADRPANRDRIGLIAFFVVLIALVGLVFRMLSPFFGTIVLAVATAMVCFPAYRWLAKKRPLWGASRRSLLITLVVLVAIVVPCLIISVSLFNEVAGAWPRVQEGLARIQVRINHPTATAPLLANRLPAPLADRFQAVLERSRERVLELGNRIARGTAQAATSLLFNLLVLLGNILLFEFLIFFLLRDGDHLLQQVDELLPFPSEFKRRLYHRIGAVVDGVFRGVVVIGAIQATIMAIGYAVIGCSAVVLLTAVSAIAILLPGVGPGLVWVPVAIYFISKGFIWKAIVLLVAGILVVVVDSTLRPLIAAPKMELSIFWFVLAMLGGLMYFGGLGLLLGPLVFGATPVFLEAYREILRDRAPAV